MPLFKERIVTYMETGLERIANKARTDRDCRFSSLAHHLTRELVLKHLKKMPKNTATGTDEVSRDEAMSTIDSWFWIAKDQIHNEGYKAPPVRRVLIPKPGKLAKRPIGIPQVGDRSLQGAVSEILSCIFEQDFLNRSYGGRPQKSAH